MSTTYVALIAVNDTITSAGSTSADATPIVRNGITTVQVVINGAGNGVAGQGVILPSDAQIGDVVEIYSDASTHLGGYTVYPDSGASIDADSTGNGEPIAYRFILRRSADLQWRTINAD
jgi:hypothetical protein